MRHFTRIYKIVFITGLLLFGINWSPIFGQVTFSELGNQLGINDNSPTLGVGWGDYDGDGYLDLFVTNTGGFVTKLFHNQSGNSFIDEAILNNVADSNGGRAIAWGDYDNDGDLDLYLSNNNAGGTDPHNRLFRNDSNGFIDVAQIMGVADGGQGNAAIWGDYDNDGDLDLFLAVHDTDNRLYRNDGNVFTDVSVSMGVANGGPGPDAEWVDFDNDGDLDLYLANYQFVPSKLYQNDGSHFTDVAVSMGVVHIGFVHEIAWGDYDNDGDMDLYLSDGVFSTPNRLFRNDGTSFIDVGTFLGVATIGNKSAVTWGDYDNNGWLDLFAAGGDGTPNHLFQNNAGTFTDVAANLGIQFVSDNSAGLGWGDYDRDGDLDLYIGNHGGLGPENGNRLLRNNGGNNNNWIIIKTVGTISNRDGIGARIKLTASSLNQFRMVNSGGGFSQNSLDTEFGLGTSAIIDEIEIRWPSGIVQTLCNVSVNQFLTIEEGTNQPPTINVSLSPDVLWPPNHKMVTIVANVTASAACDPDPTIELVSVTSNEPEQGPGKKHSPDIMGADFGTDDMEFQLRAERLGGGEGRIYTVTYNVTSIQGESATGTATVSVPHDQSGLTKNMVAASKVMMPESYALLQNYPNPFNPTTEISFAIPDVSEVNLAIYNLSGQLVRKLIVAQFPAGFHRVTWNATDDKGVRVASGMYFYVLNAGQHIEKKKLLLMK